MAYTALALAAIAAYGLTAWVRRNAPALRLVQTPNHRSSHAMPTPTGGGLGIAAGSVLAGFMLYRQDAFMLELCALALFLAATGLRDDIESLPAKIRLLVQALVCAGAVWVAAPLVPAWIMPGVWLAGLVIAGMWWINLYNFMDGIDGLAGLQAVFMLLAACAIGWDGGALSGWWMLALAAACLGFLLHNWPPAKIFMGDVGSTYVAFMIFALALVSIVQGWMSYAAWLILGAAFITDSTVTLLRRMLAGERWFEAHRSHAYQHLARRWNSHRRVTLLFLAINLFWLVPLAALAMLHASLECWWLLLAYAPLALAAFWCRAGRSS